MKIKIGPNVECNLSDVEHNLHGKPRKILF